MSSSKDFGPAASAALADSFRPGRSTFIQLGQEGKVDYATQTRLDYTWPDKNFKQVTLERSPGKASLQLGNDGPTLQSTTHASYVRYKEEEKIKTVAYKPNSPGRTAISLGTDSPSFSTTQREGFPEREISAQSKEHSKRITEEVNKRHYEYGHDAVLYKSTYMEDCEKMFESKAAGPSAYDLALESKKSEHVDASGKPITAAQFARKTHIVFGLDKREFSTTNAMPHFGVVPRQEPVDPSSWAGLKSDIAMELAATLSTSGKPLSAVSFGYEKPEYMSEAMRGMSMEVQDKKLQEDYLPVLRTRFVHDHPALREARARSRMGRSRSPSPGATSRPMMGAGSGAAGAAAAAGGRK